MTIERATEATTELVAALMQLVPQLSSAAPPTLDQVAEILANENAHVLVARSDGAIVGTLTLVVYRIPTGLGAMIEDVVVDESARGQGVGEALTREAQRIAAERRVRTVALTSRPEREAANRLYRRLGFEQRETNLYVWRPA